MTIGPRLSDATGFDIEGRPRFERLVTAVATDLINLASKDIDAGIQRTLELIGTSANVDRSYIFLIADDDTTFTMTHEWHREELRPLREQYRTLPVSRYEWLAERLRRGEPLVAPRLAALPAGAATFAQELEANGTKAVAIVPLLHAGRLLGGLGFSVVHEPKEWSNGSISLLHVSGELLVGALQRRRVEVALQDSEKRYATLVESLGEGILFCDRDDVVLHVNSRMCELAGRSREEMSGKRAYEILLPEAEKSFLIDRTRRRLSGISEAYEIELMRKDGTRFWAEIHATPIRDASGQIIGTLGAVTDISERKRAIEGLRASEKKYRDLVETSSDLIWALDLEGRFTFVNSAARRIYGYDPVYMLGKHFTEFLSPEEGERKKRMIGAVLSGYPQFQYECTERRSDGSSVVLSINALGVRDSSGAMTAVSGTATDVSERTRAEAALRKSEARFRRVFELPLIAIAITSPDKQWIDFNQKLCDMLGYSREEVLETPWPAMTHPDDLQLDLSHFEQVLAGKIDSYSIDKRFLRRDGSVLHVGMSVGCVRKLDGSIDYFIALLKDISGRVQAAEELQHQKDFLRLVIDTNPNLIFAKDFEGRFVLVNQAVADLYGTTVEGLVGKTDADFNSSPSEVEHFRADDHRVMLTGEERFIPEEPVTDNKTGEVRWFQTIKKPLFGPEGKAHQLLGVSTDITERRRAGDEALKLHRQLMQAQKMEAIGQLAAGIAHDLNNALAAVVGHLQLMKMGPDLTPNLGTSVDTALKGCKRATSLIDQLLGFSRQGKYNLQNVCLQHIVTETVKFLGRIVGTDLDIVKTGEDRDLMIAADQAQLQQALTNLIINAKHAMPSGGTVTFDFSSKFIAHPERFNPKAHSGEYAVLKVIDTGVGIAPENIDKIFEPFFTTKGAEAGTGLGLSMVYGIAQNHNGWIDVDSEVGIGTIFTLYFPLQKELPKPADLPSEGVLAKGSGLVMVVDDEPFLVELAQQFLHRAGYESQCFTDSSVALEWYRANHAKVDLIVLDMKMPRLDGRAFFDEAMKIRPDSRIVILSGFTQDEAARDILERGALHFFPKPLKYPELLAWIAQNVDTPATQPST